VDPVLYVHCEVFGDFITEACDPDRLRDVFDCVAVPERHGRGWLRCVRVVTEGVCEQVVFSCEW